VVHYLYDNVLIPKLIVYFDTLKLQRKTVEQSIQAAFGMPPERFDKVLRNYLDGGRSRYATIATPANIVAAQFTSTPVSLADARAVLADIHAHSPDHKGQALAEFQDVLKIDSNNASAMRGVGYEYLQQHDFEHAAEYFRRAAELNSKDPRVHYYYAMLLNQGGATDEARSAQIKKELLASIALEPNLADAYSLLGYTQAVSGEPEKGMEALKKAIELSPRDEHYQFNLANIYMANHRVDEAIAILRNLARSADQEVAMRANQALGQAEKFKAQSQTYALRVENGNRVENRNAENSQKMRESRELGASSEQVAHPVPTPVRFVKGKLMSVDCSSSPQAVLTVSAGAKSLKLHVRDSGHVIVIGAEHLSCDWRNKSLSVNYRERPDGEGDVVSLEVQ
jgi:Flp pilus assembly protein TadD